MGDFRGGVDGYDLTSSSAAGEEQYKGSSTVSAPGDGGRGKDFKLVDPGIFRGADET